MKMTKEQRAERKRELLAEWDERLRRFPGGRIESISTNSGLIVQLETGHGSLVVRHRNGNGAEWEDVGWIWLEEDLSSLVTFIHALTCRYSAKVAELNEIARKIAVEKLEPVNLEPSSHQRGEKEKGNDVS